MRLAALRGHMDRRVREHGYGDKGRRGSIVGAPKRGRRLSVCAETPSSWSGWLVIVWIMSYVSAIEARTSWRMTSR